MSQIFLLDIFVSHLVLVSESLEQVGNKKIVVQINFNHFPPLMVSASNSTAKALPDCKADFLFYKGQIRYFSMQIEEMVKLMEKYPLKIGIYTDGDSVPMCEVRIPLNGYARNLVSFMSLSFSLRRIFEF